jgi:hypothetical protein
MFEKGVKKGIFKEQHDTEDDVILVLFYCWIWISHQERTQKNRSLFFGKNMKHDS